MDIKGVGRQNCHQLKIYIAMDAVVFGGTNGI